jgi:3-deoxy-D-manno-octulosonate 8-phosphate phosphatase (KDO 8-P phosphatase)
MEYLGVSEIVTNCSNKPEELAKLSQKLQIDYPEIAYIGDDLNDYKAMSLCGFKACPADAVSEIKAIADYVSPSNGGDGAVRDICEKILKDNGLWEEFLALWI